MASPSECAEVSLYPSVHQEVRRRERVVASRAAARVSSQHRWELSPQFARKYLCATYALRPPAHLSAPFGKWTRPTVSQSSRLVLPSWAVGHTIIRQTVRRPLASETPPLHRLKPTTKRVFERGSPAAQIRIATLRNLDSGLGVELVRNRCYCSRTSSTPCP